jgi:hypothetical protein
MKVLVFCQRKKSFDINDCDNVKNIVYNLEKFIITNYSYDRYEDIKFEYLTSGLYGKDPSLYDADYKFNFDVFNKNDSDRNSTKHFITNHMDDYDMIILQTCPLSLVSNQLPYLFKTLKTNGILLFSNFTSDIEDTNLRILTENTVNIFIKDILETGFTKSDKNFTEYIKHQ